MKWINIYVLSSFLCFVFIGHRPVLEQGRAYAGIGGDMAAYDLSNCRRRRCLCRIGSQERLSDYWERPIKNIKERRKNYEVEMVN